MKSNRLAVSFGLPFGVGLALFAEPLIVDVLGERWRPALGLIQVFALIAAADQLGFNWTAFYRALGRTRPIAVVNVTMAVVFVAVALPLLIVARPGRAWRSGWRSRPASGLVLRLFFVQRLFPGAPLLREAAAGGDAHRARRGRGAARSPRTSSVYVVVVAAATWLLQGSLMREALGYLGPAQPGPRRAGDPPGVVGAGEPPQVAGRPRGRSARAPSRRRRSAAGGASRAGRSARRSARAAGVAP